MAFCTVRIFISTCLFYALLAEALPTLTPLHFQSKSISFADWVSLLTLCFAPLIAHVIAGVPKITILHNKEPRWHDIAVLFNPLSIMWRYFAVAHRRLQTLEWNPVQAAAANAVFWIGSWDGSERMINASRRFLIEIPLKPHLELFSSSLLKTAIVGLQGIQAVYIFSASSRQLTDGPVNIATHAIAVDSLFIPLALLGLLRLFPAFWLIEDYTYSRASEKPSTSLLSNRRPLEYDSITDPALELSHQRPPKLLRYGKYQSSYQHVESDDLTEDWDHSYARIDSDAAERMHGFVDSRPSTSLRPTNNWRSILFRLIYWSVVAFVWVLCMMFLVPDLMQGRGMQEVTTTFVVNIYYLLILTPAFFLFTYYFVCGRHINSTIIPCISSVWYRIYSVVFALATVFLIVMAVVETRQTPCGKSTMWPTWTDIDAALCPGLRSIGPNNVNGSFGIATWAQNGSARLSGNFRVMQSNGYFLGDIGEAHNATFLDGFIDSR